MGTGNGNNVHKSKTILEKEFFYNTYQRFFRQTGFMSRKLLLLEGLFSLTGHVGDEKFIILCWFQNCKHAILTNTLKKV